MNYEKLGLKNGEVFKEEHIAHIDEALSAAAIDINSNKEKFNSLRAGGRNYLSVEKSEGPFTVTGGNSGSEADNYAHRAFEFSPVYGETYTFSVDVKPIQGEVQEITIRIYTGTVETSARAEIPIPRGGRISHTFTIDDSNINQILVYAGVAGSTRGNKIELSNAKIEKGNICIFYL